MISDSKVTWSFFSRLPFKCFCNVSVNSIDCKTVVFFLEIGKACHKILTRAKRASLTRPQGPSLTLRFQPPSRPFVWLLARTWIRKNTDCFAVYKFNVMCLLLQINAMANKAAGKGYENTDFYENVKFQFVGIENIHVMRQSLQKMIECKYCCVLYFLAVVWNWKKSER